MPRSLGVGEHGAECAAVVCGAGGRAVGGGASLPVLLGYLRSTSTHQLRTAPVGGVNDTQLSLSRPCTTAVGPLSGTCPPALKALLFESLAQTGTAEYEDLALVEFLRHDGGNVHSRRHDHLGVASEVHAVSLSGHLLRRIASYQTNAEAMPIARLDNGRGSARSARYRTTPVPSEAGLTQSYLGCVFCSARSGERLSSTSRPEQGNVNGPVSSNLGGHLRNDSLGFVHLKSRQALSLNPP